MINLKEELIKLQRKLRDNTKKTFNRVNPFFEDLIDWKEQGEYVFGKNKNITLYNSSCVVGDVEVGKNTWIGPYTALDGGKYGIKIGENCTICSGVNIITHDTVKWALSGGKEDYEYAPIEIGDNCFIGTNAFISKGIKIGRSCLIGACSLVTKDIPDYSIVFGIPAKITGKVEIVEDKVKLNFD
tara:strand:+ start:4114 stop:4668 length:555 start_codon:yes stop_codon:yes gene_type:complete